MGKYLKQKVIFLLITVLLSACFPLNGTSQQAEVPLTDTDLSLTSPQPPVTKSEGAIPLIFSHDGAPDDIAAIVYLTNHPDINLIGVIQSYGEQHPTRSLDKWQRFIYESLNYVDLPIGIGSVSPLDPSGNEFPATWRAGADDFWGISLPEANADYDHFKGVDLLIALVQSSPHPVTVLVTGAQTDLALALNQEPTIADNIGQVVAMGGAFNVPGNLGESHGNKDNTVAEWNIFVDALAAKTVFNAGVPLTVISLDGSNDLLITRGDLARLADSTAPGVGVLKELWEQSLGWSGGAFKIWDIVAAAAVTTPEYFSWAYDALDVVTDPGPAHGQTIALEVGSATSRYSFATDYDAVRQAIIGTLE